jgi:hypothetical protein
MLCYDSLDHPLKTRGFYLPDALTSPGELTLSTHVGLSRMAASGRLVRYRSRIGLQHLSPGYDVPRRIGDRRPERSPPAKSWLDVALTSRPAKSRRRADPQGPYTTRPARPSKPIQRWKFGMAHQSADRLQSLHVLGIRPRACESRRTSSPRPLHRVTELCLTPRRQ